MTTLISLSERLGNSIFTLTWQTGLLILVVAITTFCLRKARPALRYALWLVVLIRLCVPVGISTPLGIPPKVVQQATPRNVTPPPEQPQWNADSRFVNAEMPASTGQPEREIRVIPAPHLQKPALQTPKASLPPLSIHGWLGLTWFLVALILAVLMSLRMWLVRRIICKSEPVTNPKLNELLDELRARLGIRRAVALRMLPATAKTLGPCATGIIRPVIFIPARMVEYWDAKALEPILLHELAHIRRGDLIVHAMQVLVQIVYWFHPLVWFSNARLRHERELICDDMAVAHSGGNSKRYGATVLRAVEEFQQSSSPIAGLGIGESKLATRLKRLFGKSYTVPRPLGIMALIAVLLGGVLGVMIASEGKPTPQIAKSADENTEGRRIRIAITDENGVPVQGAKVVPLGLYVPKKYLFEKHPGFNAVPQATDGAGSVSFVCPLLTASDNEAGSILLTVNHPDFVPAQFQRPVKIDEDTYKLVKGSEMRVSGYIEDASKPVPGVRPQLISHHEHFDGSANIWMEEKGVLQTSRFPKGTAWLQLVKFDGKTPTHFSEATKTPDRSEAEMNLPLKPALVLEGKLDSRIPRPIKNGWVALRVLSRQMPELSTSTHVNISRIFWQTGVEVREDGTFRFPALPSGDLEIRAACEGFVSADSLSVRSGLIEAETFKTKYPEAIREISNFQDKQQLTFALVKDVKDFELPMVAEGIAEIEVRSPDGKPLQDATVTFTPDFGQFSWWRYDSATVLLEGSGAYKNFIPRDNYSSRTDSAGIARIKNLPAGQQGFHIEHDTFIQDSGSSAQWNMRVESGGTAKLTVKLLERRNETPIPKIGRNPSIQPDPKAFELRIVVEKKTRTTKEYVFQIKDGEPEKLQVESEVLMDGTSVESASVGYGQDGYEVILQFTELGAKRFREITKQNVGKRIGIFVFDELFSAPNIREPIFGSRATISQSGKTEEEAKALADKINQPVKKSDAAKESTPKPKPTADAGASAEKPKTFLKVVDQSGNPIAGATVLRWYPKATSTSNSEGLADATPLIENLGDANPKQIGLNVDAPGYCMEQVHVELGKPWDPVVLKKGGVLEVSGYLDDPTKILKNVFVQITTTSWLQEPKPLTWTEPQPGVKRHDRVPLEVIWVRAFHIKDDGDLLFSKDTRVDMRSVVPPKLNLQLYPGVKLQGRFDETVPRPVQNGWVCMEVCSEEVVRPDYLGFGRLNWRAEIQVNPDGTFSTPSLPSGEITVVAGSKGFVYQGAMHQGNRLGLVMKPDQNRLVIPMERAASMEVKVVDLKGQPVAGADVDSDYRVYWNQFTHGVAGPTGFSSSVYFSTGKGAPLPLKREIDCSAKTNAEGVALVGCFQRDKTSGWVKHPDFEIAEFETRISADQIASVTVQMAPKGVITAREVVNFLKENELVHETKDSLWNLLMK